jgi:hypothetical protein
MNARDFSQSLHCLAYLSWHRIYCREYGEDSTRDWLFRYGLTDKQVAEVFERMEGQADQWAEEYFKRSKAEAQS